MNRDNFACGKLVIKALGIVMLMFGWMGMVHAACSGDPMRFISYSGPGTITVPRDAPDGTVLYSETKVIPASDFRCTTQELWGFNLASGRGTPPASKVTEFPLGVPGLSFRIKAPLGDGMTYMASLYPLRAGSYHLKGDMVLEIFKTGALAPSGVVQTGDLGRVKFGTHDIVDIFIGRDIKIVAASCETPDVNVVMGEDYNLDDFSGPGSTTREVPFSIKLNNCPKGIAKANYQLNALTPVVDAARGVIELNKTSSAVGIGLQIKDEGGVPVPLNMPRAFTGYDSNGGNFVIPLKASYYRLATELLKPGSANTEVTFIMSYL